MDESHEGRKKKWRSMMRKGIQLISLGVIALCIASYALFALNLLDRPFFPFSNFNPYGGISLLFHAMTDGDFRWEGLGSAASLTLAIVVSAIIGGRFFCKNLCPLGTIQDICNVGSTKLGLKQKSLDGKSQRLLYLKYFVMLGAAFSVIAGVGSTIAAFSPWSALLSLGTMNAVAGYLWQGAVVLGFLCVIALFVPRFFCRVLCPLGAFQGLLVAMGMYRTKPEMKCGCQECVGCAECKPVNEEAMILGKAMSQKSYLILMLIVFFGIWYLVPQGSDFFQQNLLGQGQQQGSVLNLKDGIYEGQGQGFRGKMTVEVVVSQDKIEKISILSHEESPGWYEEVFATLPKEMIKEQRVEVDSITGATFTSQGLKDAVENALEGNK